MIPQRLVLKNFLSYREASLDFRGLHTACICGANGAGKSSLLEAIVWAIWGQSRAASEDDVIHLGAQEAQVDFIFTNQQQTYRIIRSRYRGQTTTLEFQVVQAGGQEGTVAAEHPLPPASSFRTLTAKGVRATQQLILEHLKLDYETFVNSAYLRQGRADEFMLKRPGERKEILTDLLKLGQYDDLTERAKDRARQLKGQIDLLERNLERVQLQLQEDATITQEQAALEATLSGLQLQQQADSEQLQVLQATQQQRQTWQQQLTWQQQQLRILTQDCQRFQRELEASRQQQQQLESLLHQEEAIARGYHHLQTLQTQEESFAAAFKAYQLAQVQRQQYQQQQTEAIAALQAKLQHVGAQLEGLQQQEAEIQHSLSKADDIRAALDNLRQARTHLERLDQLQVQATPLLQRRQQLQTQLDRVQTRLAARLEELQTSAQQLQSQQDHLPRLEQAAIALRDQLATLEQRRLYQQQVLERGLERRALMERLQADQRNYETQLAAVEQKIQLLRQQGEAEQNSRESTPGKRAAGKRQRAKAKGETASPQLPSFTAPPASIVRLSAAEASHPASLLLPLFPPCPLCDRPLDEHHLSLVMTKHEAERQETLDQVWVIREQLSAAEREIQILRQEYRDLEQELNEYDRVLERRGQLQEKLQGTIDLQASLNQVRAEAEELERSLQTGDYAAELHTELQLLDATLQQLSYDEKDHALARGEVDRWRWAEIRQAEVRQAQRRQQQLTQRQPELEAEAAGLQNQLTQIQREMADYLATLDRHIAALNYSPEQHEEFRRLLRDAQPWQVHYQELCQAKQQHSQVRQRCEQLAQTLQERQQTLESVEREIHSLTQQLAATPDRQSVIQTLEQQLHQRRSHLDETLSHLGRLQQQQQHLAELKTQTAKLKTDLQHAQRQYRVYHELAQAFGKNGIQALMIENALPQLEAETNQILSRLSANQLHVQFVTQKSNRKSQTAKLVETLDILIADANGTRPYETYSGGEAFRVNFAVRLALARLLAHRSGTALQMLIVDEGFGTQDAEGCDRLIAAINAIAPDFACILAVTHVPHFKEAFQSRIEVYKTEQGSQLTLVA